MTYLIILVMAASVVSLFYASSVAWFYLVDGNYFREALSYAAPVAITVGIGTAMVILLFILSIFLPF